jgi:transposase
MAGCGRAARWQDGARTRPQIGRAAAWLGSVEGDRLVDPEATPKEPQIGFARSGGGIQKKLADTVAEEAAKHPGKKVEVFATDEHRIGLKPVTRRVWAPRAKRPIAPGHHRFDWLYVTAFASPATGETFWYVSNGVSKEFFEALLETFGREAEAGLSRILLVLDNAGWHGPANLKIPDGIRLIYLPPYSPELQPAETLWALVDEPVVNKHIATIADLDAKIAAQCIALTERPEQIQSRTGFHWWPKPISPN